MNPREVWEQAASTQRERWREHVEDALPERLLAQLQDGPPAEEPTGDRH